MSYGKRYLGDCLEILKTLPSESVQCCVTSPPYWGLRDYGVDGQLGLEKTPSDYVEKIVAVFQEVRRVLRNDGTLWLNLGDSYANKNLIGIPWRVAFALQTDGWWLRSEIIWSKPNPMPESVTDRPTKSHEQIFLLTKSSRYYYDSEAVSEPVAEKWEKSHYQYYRKLGGVISEKKGAKDYKNGERPEGRLNTFKHNTRNRHSVWTIVTNNFKGAHFATFPINIPTICIKAGSKIGDTIIDPFAGAFTTAIAAINESRKYLCIELSPAYFEIGRQRIAKHIGELFQTDKM